MDSHKATALLNTLTYGCYTFLYGETAWSVKSVMLRAVSVHKCERYGPFVHVSPRQKQFSNTKKKTRWKSLITLCFTEITEPKLCCCTGDGSTVLCSLGFITVCKTWTSEQHLCLHPKAVKVLLSCFSLSCRNSNCRSRRVKPWPPTKIQRNLNKQNTGN